MPNPHLTHQLKTRIPFPTCSQYLHFRIKLLPLYLDVSRRILILQQCDIHHPACKTHTYTRISSLTVGNFTSAPFLLEFKFHSTSHTEFYPNVMYFKPETVLQKTLLCFSASKVLHINGYKQMCNFLLPVSIRL